MTGYAEWNRRREARIKLKLYGYPVPAANVGRNHPDYGMTVQEHNKAKAERK